MQNASVLVVGLKNWWVVVSDPGLHVAVSGSWNFPASEQDPGPDSMDSKEQVKSLSLIFSSTKKKNVKTISACTECTTLLLKAFKQNIHCDTITLTTKDVLRSEYAKFSACAKAPGTGTYLLL